MSCYCISYSMAIYRLGILLCTVHITCFQVWNEQFCVHLCILSTPDYVLWPWFICEIITAKVWDQCGKNRPPVPHEQEIISPQHDCLFCREMSCLFTPVQVPDCVCIVITNCHLLPNLILCFKYGADLVEVNSPGFQYLGTVKYLWRWNIVSN